MSKRNKIIYWVATLWMALGMLSSAVVQLIRMEEEVENMARLGYPIYFLTVLGIWKILGVIILLMPGWRLLKEWAYAGFFFTMSGAIISHVVAGDNISEIFPSAFLLLLTVLSWYFRPPDRRIAPIR